MRSPRDFLPLLGPVSGESRSGEIREIGLRWGVELPDDFVQTMGLYGDLLISGYLYLRGANTLNSDTAQRMREILEAGRTVQYKILPSAGGVLLWGHTIEGDQLLLVPRPGGSWSVSAFRRNRHDVYDSDLSFGDWLYGALRGEVADDWLPAWPPPPYFCER